MNAFANWFDRNRTSIGYTAGIMNILSGVGYLATGQMLSAACWLIIGSAIVFDTRTYK